MLTWKIKERDHKLWIGGVLQKPKLDSSLISQKECNLSPLFQSSKARFRILTLLQDMY